jgi:hypothetical protein
LPLTPALSPEGRGSKRSFFMVGLFGVYRKRRVGADENKKVLEKMTEAMGAEKGDIADGFADERIAAGRISGGVFNRYKQPVSDRQKRYHLFMDGQIYDYEGRMKQLQNEGGEFTHNSEEEVVLNLFLRHGTNAVKYLKGVFLIVIYDAIKEVLYIMNSRYGHEYFYYYSGPDAVVFGSSIKAILALDMIPGKVNQKAIYDFIKFEFITGNETFFKDIKLFPYASVLTVDRNSALRFNHYWDYPDIINENSGIHRSVSEWGDRGAFLLKRAVKRQLKENIKPGIISNGRPESRTIGAYLKDLDQGFNVYHINHAEDPGTAISEGVRLSDGHISSNQFWLLDCVKKIKDSNEVNCILDGFCLDVLFRPVPSVKPEKSYYSISERIDIINKAFSLPADEFVPDFFTKKFFGEMISLTRGNILDSIKNSAGGDISSVIQKFHFVNKARRFVRGMPMVNRHFVEYAFPGLDYDLFDFGLSLPRDVYIRREVYKRIIARQSDNGSGAPEKKKAGWRCFNRVPARDLDSRFRQDPEVRRFFVDILKDERTLSRGYIDRKGVEKLIYRQDKGKNHISTMQSIVSIELWHRNFV